MNTQLLRSKYNTSRLAALILSTILSCIGTNAFAEDVTFDGDNLKYSIANGVATVTGFADNASDKTKVNIPATITTSDEKTVNVTSIKEDAFYSLSDITSVVVGDNVTSIGDRAFYKCSYITSVVIGDNVTTIGEHAFYDCSSLSSVTMGNKVETIGKSAFGYCKALTSVTIPSTVTSIGDNAFTGCTGLEGTIVIPSGVTSINSNVFDNCSSLEGITFQGNVTSIGVAAFYDCSSLKKITLPSTVESIGTSAFANCTGLESINIPDGVTSLGACTFYKCSSLTSITIPSKVTSISEGAFDGCTGLTSVTSLNPTPPTVTTTQYLKNFADNVKSSATLYVPAGSLNAYKAANEWKGFKKIEELPIIDESDGVTIYYKYTDDDKNALEVTKGETNTGAIIIPETVSYNGETLSVISIGEKAFHGYTGLKEVTIPSSVTSIGASAFAGCTNLATVTSLIQKPFTIGSDVFDEAVKANATLYVPKGTKKAYQEAVGWKEFTNIDDGTKEEEEKPDEKDDEDKDEEEEDETPDENEDTPSDEDTPESEPDITERTDDGSIMSFNYGDNTQEVKVTKGDYSGDVTIPESVNNIPVTGIESGAFSGCTNLTSVNIPRSVTTIGDNAFGGCSSLESITIRSTVETIGAGAFDGCTSLEKVVAEDIPAWCNIDFENVGSNPLSQAGHLYSDDHTEITALTIPNAVENIGAHAFAGGVGLESVTIQKGVKNIGAGAFDGCSSLEKVIAEDLAAWCDINFENVGSNPLSQAGHLYSDDHTEITDLTIPNTVQGIGEAAFAGGIGLKSVSIGNDSESEESHSGVTEVGSSAFYGCSNLVSVTLRNSVESIGAFAFCDCDMLDSIAIPSSVKEIGDMAFYCSNITKVVSNISEPFAIEASVFGGNTLMNGTLFVPEGTVKTYKSAAGWREFRNIIGGISTGTEGINADKVTVQSNGGALHINGAKDGTRITIYSMTGAKVSETKVAGGTATIPTTLRRGDIAILRIGDTSVKVVMQ